jgi:hypothetical protein
MTRREILMLPFAAVPVFASAANEFWNEKKPEDWTKDEVQEMLTKSPWAKEAAVSVFGGAGGSLLNRNGAMNRYGTMTNSGRAPTNPKQADDSDLRYKAFVRWESARPVREALKLKPTQALADYYILAVVGDLTLADPDEDEAQRESRIDMMKQSTKLDKRGGPIPLTKIEIDKKEGTLFYFSRVELIKDGQVTFTARLGPVEVKCKFTVKEMMYHGKLDL